MGRKELSALGNELSRQLRIEHALAVFTDEVIYTAPSGKQYANYILEYADDSDEVYIASYRDNSHGVGYGWQTQWVTSEQLSEVAS